MERRILNYPVDVYRDGRPCSGIAVETSVDSIATIRGMTNARGRAVLPIRKHDTTLFLIVQGRRVRGPRSIVNERGERVDL